MATDFAVQHTALTLRAGGNNFTIDGKIRCKYLDNPVKY